MLSSCLSLVASPPEANEAIGASSQGRSRCLAAYEYGPPLFQIGDMVKIIIFPSFYSAFLYRKARYSPCIASVETLDGSPGNPAHE